MSITAPYTSVFGPMVGRGDVERFVVTSLQTWLITYVAEYERQHFLPPRSTPVPPTPESIRGDMDFTRWDSLIFPAIVAVVQPTGEAERHESGEYGSWYNVSLGAFVQVEGDQDTTRALADIYGTVLQTVLTEQGIIGVQSDQVTPIPTRTRLTSAYGLTFPDPEVRDVIQCTLGLRVFVADIVSDLAGPLTVPANPYATPQPWPAADQVTVGLIRGTPDTHGTVLADEVEIDATVNPNVTRYQTNTVNEP